MGTKFIDLSLEIYDGAPTYEEDPQCSIIRHTTIKQGGSNCTRLSLSSHQGTHMDAPFHFIEDGSTIDVMPSNNFFGEAFLIDFSRKKNKEPIDVKDFLPYEDKITEGARIVYRTGFDKLFPQKEYFFDFPFLTKEAADWLAHKRISLLGMDTPTPNPVDFTYVHRTLLKNNIAILEGLCNLRDLNREKFILIAAPLKVKGCDAAPVRAFAVEEDKI